MTDETQDPDLEIVRANWDAPPPGPKFHERVMTAYEHDVSGTPLWRRWFATRVPLPVALAAVVAAFVLAFFAAPRSRAPVPQRLEFATAGGYRYKPVQRPRFVVISQGEHP